MRNIVRRNSIRSGVDSSMFTDTDIDVAIQSAADEMNDHTMFCERVDTITLTAGTAELQSLPTNFMASRLLDAYLTSSNVVTFPPIYGAWLPYTTRGGPNAMIWGGGWPYEQSAELTVTDPATIINLRQGAPASYQPYMMAFTNYFTGMVYPTPNYDFSLLLRWYEPFTQFVPGTQGTWSATKTYYPGDTASTGTTIFEYSGGIAGSAGNNPTNATYWTVAGTGVSTAPSTISAPTTFTDNILRPVLIDGAACYLLNTDPDRKYAQTSRANFDRYIARMGSRGNIGVRSITKNGRG